MATPQSSILRQAILGHAAPAEGEDAGVASEEQNRAAWDRSTESDSGSAVRPPPSGPIRWSGGHAGHMKLLFENAPVAMAMFDTEMRYLLANRRWLEDFKLVDADFVGRCQYDLFPGLHPGWRHVYERALGGQIVRSDRDAVTQHGRPVLYRWEVGPWRHPDTTIGGVMISCERLYASPVEPPTVQEGEKTRITGDGLWESGLPLLAIAADGRIVKASHGAAELLLGVSSGGKDVSFWEAFGGAKNQESLRKHVIASVESVLSAGRAYAVMFTEDGQGPAEAPTQWLVSRLEGDSNGVSEDLALVIGLPGLTPFTQETVDGRAAHDAELQELTEQLTRMQAAVKESADSTSVARQREARLRAVLDLAPCGLMVLDDHARPIYHNSQVALLLGRGLREGGSIEEWLAEGARDEMHEAEIARRWTEGVWRKHLTLPLALTAADGLLREIEMRPAALPGGGLLVLMQDVTESRRAEEMLRSTEAKYRTLVHESPVPIILADRTAAVFDVNPAAEALLGHTRAELRRMGLESWLDEEGIAARAEKLAEMQERGERSASLKLNLVTRNGASSPVDLRLALVSDAAGQLLFSIHFFSPVAIGQPAPAVPQKAESAPHPRETRTHAMLLLTTDVHGRIQEWSDDATERFGYEPSEIIGRGLHMLFSPSDATGFYSNLLALAASDGAQPAPIDWTFFHKSEGRQKGPFLMHLHEGHGLAGSLMEEVIVISPVSADGATGTDDSEESRVLPLLLDDVPEDTVRPAPPVKPTPEELSRERILLGEAHHRVKNHLQIITSMLNLQMSTLHNDEARDALRSSQNRVRSIAALHQHLFQLTTGAAADFKSFACGLIGHLRECYQVDEQRVPLQLTVPDRPVPEEWLMPLALSLNEMVANAFKHAYAGDREGSMSVTLSWDDSGGDLSVVDDGAGLPSGFSHHDSTGLGLKILRVFAGQLGGEVKIEGSANQGTAFRLTFPVLSDEMAEESPPAS